MLNLPCVIFAGGKSSRMGEDKSLLPFGNFKTLSEFQLDKLKKIFSELYISTKNPQKFDFKANFIVDTSDIFAPTSGFISIFEQLSDDAIFVMSVDTPFISKETILKLAKSHTKEDDVTIATLNGKIQPLCGIYTKALYEKFVKMQENAQHKLSILLKESKTRYVDFSDNKEFLNLNNPQEYQEALMLC